MFRMYALAGVLGSAMLAGAAFAQTATTTTSPTTSPMAPTTAAATSSYAGTWRASKLVGLNVFNENSESLGSINDVLLDRSGNIKAVVIGVGGFLGVGEHLVAVTYDQLKFVDDPLKTAAMATPAAPAAGGSGATRPVPSTTTGAATTSTTSATARNPWYPDHAVLNATKDQLKAMTQFKYATN